MMSTVSDLRGCERDGFDGQVDGLSEEDGSAQEQTGSDNHDDGEGLCGDNCDAIVMINVMIDVMTNTNIIYDESKLRILVDSRQNSF